MLLVCGWKLCNKPDRWSLRLFYHEGCANEKVDVPCQSLSNYGKLLYVFQFCLFFIQGIQVCDTKVLVPIKLAENK